MRRIRRSTLLEGNYRDWTDLSDYREHARGLRPQLRLIRKSEAAAGLRLFSVMRNEHDLLPGFLEHYRNLGVVRFVIVDNDSSDGTHELLLQQPDVDLYHTGGSYAAANGGTLWVDALIDEQARGDWIVYADADELLVYDQCDKYPLQALANHLEAIGETKLLAPMVDLYPCADSSQHLLFDAMPERCRRTGRGLIVEGGPRSRMAVLRNETASPCLTKYPFVRYGRRNAYANTHFPYPSDGNGYRIFGRLLHLKLTARFKGKVAEALREGQHWNGGIEYQRYAEWLDGRDTIDLATEHSRRYTGPADLIAAGLLEPLQWQLSNSRLRVTRVLRRMLLRPQAARPHLTEP